MAEFLSERKLLFVRKEFDFPSKKNSFSFEQKIRGLITRTYLSPFMYVCVSLRERSRRSIHTYVEGDRYYCLRELFPVAVFVLLKPRFMFLGVRRKILAKIMRHKINLRIFKFYEYGDILTSIYMNRMLWIY